MEKDMLILSADTSSSRFSTALLEKDRLIDEFESKLLNSHSSDLLPEIDRLLSRNSLAIEDIGGFCIGLGPGSFTGLRVGLTTMRAMALALNKPIVGIPSIDAISYNLFGHEGRLCPIIDARQERVYARVYNCSKNSIRPETRILLLGIKELIKRIRYPTRFLGDGLNLYKNDIERGLGQKASFAPESFWYPKAAIAGRLGFGRLRAARSDNAFKLLPLYIYPKECQIKR